MLFIAQSPFITAYLQSDWLGRAIFFSLFALSILTWVIIWERMRHARLLRASSSRFRTRFREASRSNLSKKPLVQVGKNPFESIYLLWWNSCASCMRRNRSREGERDFLTPTDLQMVGDQLDSAILEEMKGLECRLYILSTAASLAPFLGLLGTVWGILVTFSDLTQAGGGMQEVVLSGLSLALTTTVLGLVIAIPALVGYNYLRQKTREVAVEMEQFSTELLTLSRWQYER